MSVDWELIKQTLNSKPDYETLIEQINEILSYNFVQTHYIHDLDQAVDYAKKIMGKDPRQRYTERIITYTDFFNKIKDAGIKARARGYSSF